MDIPIQPDLYLWDYRIQEPVTTFTDLLIAFSSLAAFYLLRGVKQRSSKLMRNYFLLMGIATLLGAFFGHAFTYKVGFYGRFPGWYASMFSIMFIERASIHYASHWLTKRALRILLAINILELIVMVLLTTITEDFRFVQIHSAYGVLFIAASFHAFAYYRSRSQASATFLKAVLVLLFATFVYNYPLVIHPFFNHLDFAHCLMAMATWIIYYSTKQMESQKH